MLKVLKNAELFAPEYLGKKDLLIASEKIVEISETITINGCKALEIVDAKNFILVPGFIDSHAHIIGGGGEGGFDSRIPEIDIAQIIESGVTTVVGCLGTDGFTRCLKSLVAKAKGLSKQGVNTKVFTGSYQVPVKTITDSIENDLILIDPVIGVGEIALADHRSSAPTINELSKIAAAARVGGMISGKCGIVNIHLGQGTHSIDMLLEVVNSSMIPVTQFLPTHANRSEQVFEQCVKFCHQGGYIDFTASTGSISASKALYLALKDGLNNKKLTFSSDAQGSLPVFDKNGKCISVTVASIKSLHSEFKNAVLKYDISLDNALRAITSNPATILGLQHTGKIALNHYADILLLDKDSLDICAVMSKGKWLKSI